MKTFATLALFLLTLLPCPGPIIIRPVGGGGGGTLLLDDVAGAAGGWSVDRQLDADYTGPIVRVRRAEDSEEADCAFASGRLTLSSAVSNFSTSSSATTLNEFLGGGANPDSLSDTTQDAFVTTIYNQSGGAFGNFVQTTTANQPQIADEGVLLADGNSNVYAQFDDSNDEMSFADNFGAPYTFWTVFTTGTLNNNERLYGVTTTTSTLQWQATPATIIYDNNAASLNLGAGLANATQYLIQHGVDATNLNGAINNGTEQTTTRGGTSATTTNFFIGSRGGGNYHGLRFHEMYLWESDVTGDAGTVQTNVNSHYSIW